MTGGAREFFDIFLFAGRVAAWILVTIWLGVWLVVETLVVLGRLSRLKTETRKCPAGHPVVMYGHFDCVCGAVHEGWVFGRCVVCGQTCGWTPCPHPACGLPVRNPLV